MNSHDPGGEFLRIAERYRQMSDSEIRVLMPQSSQLTPMAQDALASEVRSRGLKPEDDDVTDEAPSAASKLRAPDFFRLPPQFRDPNEMRFPNGDSAFAASSQPGEGGKTDIDDSSSEEDPYQEDRKLVDLCTVWSERDALQVQEILDAAGIPFFMGAEKASGVDGVTSDFTKGIIVKIMQIGVPWARGPMSHFEPDDDPTPKEEEKEPEETPVRCPKCQSEEVVFEGLKAQPGVTDEAAQKFEWSCDACGARWEDDGVAG